MKCSATAEVLTSSEHKISCVPLLCAPYHGSPGHCLQSHNQAGEGGALCGTQCHSREHHGTAATAGVPPTQTRIRSEKWEGSEGGA